MTMGNKLTGSVTPAVARLANLPQYKTAAISSLQPDADIINLASNENPYGCSEKVMPALAKVQTNRYPENSYQALHNAIATQYGIPANQIIAGRGSDEVLHLICQAYASGSDKVLHSQYGFTMYPILARLVDAEPVAIKENNYHFSVPECLRLVNSVANCKIVFIAHPNNPTGSYLRGNELRTLLEQLAGRVLVVIDAAYQEYVDCDDYPDPLALVDEFNNLIVTRTFSKIYGLAGLRIGWGYGNPEIIANLNRVRPPFNTSQTAASAAIAALGDQAFVAGSRMNNSTQKQRLLGAIRDLGYDTLPAAQLPQGNFILANFANEEQAKIIFQHLRSHGIIVRQLQSYQLPTCLRFTIGTATEIDACIQLLNKLHQGNNN